MLLTLDVVREEIQSLEKDEVLELFKDFEIIKFDEIEKDRKTGLGKIKHWHIYDIIARKK